CSAMRAEVNSPKATTAVQKVLHMGSADLMNWPTDSGRISGATKYQRNICTRSGTLRKSSTQAAHSASIQRIPDVRSTPTMTPSAKARHQAATETLIVHPRPRTKVYK